MRGSQPWRTNRTRVLRANETSAEARLWYELRNRNLAGHKFIRQAALDTYVADFLCREARLIVEVAGATHGAPAELAYDEKRTAELRAHGYRIFRCTNDDVFTNLDGVLEGILHALEGGSG